MKGLKSIVVAGLIAALALPLASSALYGEVEVKTNVEAEVETDAKGHGKVEEGQEGILDVEVTTANLVSTSADLEVFATTIESENENVADVNTESEGKIEVKYKHKGKFLGFIPVRISYKTVVESNDEGQVEVRTEKPWWGVFVAGTSEVDAQVETIADSGSFSAAVGANASAAAQARAIEAIVAAHAAIDTSLEVK